MKIKSRYNDKINICVHCKSEFHPIYNRPDSKYCSMNCYLSHRWGPKTPANNCLVCNKPCTSTGGKKQKYCSVECRNNGRIGKPNVKGRNRITKICSWCEKEVTRPESNFHGDKTFCDYDCMAQWQSENVTGKNHPRWSGGYSRAYGTGWKCARKEVMKRNDGICERCNSSESKNVHHILPVRYFARKEEAHFDTNLIAVCYQCHADLHKELKEALPLLDLLQSSYQKENPI